MAGCEYNYMRYENVCNMRQIPPFRCKMNCMIIIKDVCVWVSLRP